MPNIVPVSDLRNYNAVIGQVSYGNPVYLTPNGRGDCAIIDIKLFERFGIETDYKCISLLVFLIFLYMFDLRPEQRIARQYKYAGPAKAEGNV